MNLDTLRYKQRLDSLFKKYEDLPDDYELKAHWSRYLCVLVSGFIEIAVRETYSEYSKKQASTNVSNFVAGNLSRFRNPKMGRILEITGQFSEDWRLGLEGLTEGEQKDAVDSVVDNRNRIAHGENVGLSYSILKEYYRNVVKVVDAIENQIP